jgi:hypothetical protein
MLPAICSIFMTPRSWRSLSNADKLEFTGDATAIAENVAENASTWGAVFSASQNGVLVYQAGGHTVQGELRWYDRQGRNLGALGTGNYYGPRLSADGVRLAVDFGDPNRDVWIFDLRRGLKTRLSFGAVDAAPVWSPDGSRIATYTSSRPDSRDEQRRSSAAYHAGAELDCGVKEKMKFATGDICRSRLTDFPRIMEGKHMSGD